MRIFRLAKVADSITMVAVLSSFTRCYSNFTVVDQ